MGYINVIKGKKSCCATKTVKCVLTPRWSWLPHACSSVSRKKNTTTKNNILCRQVQSWAAALKTLLHTDTTRTQHTLRSERILLHSSEAAPCRVLPTDGHRDLPVVECYYLDKSPDCRWRLHLHCYIRQHLNPEHPGENPGQTSPSPSLKLATLTAVETKPPYNYFPLSAGKPSTALELKTEAREDEWCFAFDNVRGTVRFTTDLTHVTGLCFYDDVGKLVSQDSWLVGWCFDPSQPLREYIKAV